MSFLPYRSGSVGALAGDRQGHPARSAQRRPWLLRSITPKQFRPSWTGHRLQGFRKPNPHETPIPATQPHSRLARALCPVFSVSFSPGRRGLRPRHPPLSRCSMLIRASVWTQSHDRADANS
jgi:hypothetical protein